MLFQIYKIFQLVLIGELKVKLDLLEIKEKMDVVFGHIYVHAFYLQFAQLEIISIIFQVILPVLLLIVQMEIQIVAEVIHKKDLDLHYNMAWILEL